MTAVRHVNFGAAGGLARLSEAKKPAQSVRLPAVRIDPGKLRSLLRMIIREILTLAAVAGLMWFQWQILRCCW